MNDEIRLNDIADELLILNKTTIDTLFRLDNCSDCIALYVFYYKTAKWQKTNTIKANDTYIKKSLKWGADKIRKTKQALKENGLINIIQRRENGKIQGWYVEVSYLVSQKKTDELKVKVEEAEPSNNTQKQQHLNPTSSNEEINALKEYIKSLKKEIEVLNKKASNNKPTFDELIDNYTNDETIKDLLKEWLKVRKAKRSAMTNRAIELNLNKLDKLAKESNLSVKEYLEEVIIRGWAAFYAIKNYKYNASNNYKRTEEVPEWLNKETKADPISDEDKKEVEGLLKEFKPNLELQARLKSKYGKKNVN
ncbi:MAG: hypothetical protein J6D28_04435 [Bacilli bacterium]|nr:hypothetical protein [Bacilli bacterium]